MLNIAGYYDPLLSFLHSSVDQQFMDAWQMGLIHTGTDPARLLPELIQAAGITRPSKLDFI